MYEEPELPRGYTRKSSSEKFGDCTCIFETIFSSCVRISTAACFFWITGVLGFRSYWCFFQPGSDTRGETLHSGYTFFSQPLRRKSADVRSGNHTKSLAPGRVREGEASWPVAPTTVDPEFRCAGELSFWNCTQGRPSVRDDYTPARIPSVLPPTQAPWRHIRDRGNSLIHSLLASLTTGKAPAFGGMALRLQYVRCTAERRFKILVGENRKCETNRKVFR